MDVIIIAALFGVFGIVVGWKVGTVWGGAAGTDRQYWMRNLVVVLVGVALSTVVSAVGLVTLAGLTIGLMGGAIAGLKMGYGKSVGVWQRHDRFFRVNQDQVAASKSAEEARAAGMSEGERAARDLVSAGGDASKRGRDR